MLDDRLDALAETIRDGVADAPLLSAGICAIRRGDAAFDAWVQSLTDDERERAQAALSSLYRRMAAAVAP